MTCTWQQDRNYARYGQIKGKKIQLVGTHKMPFDVYKVCPDITQCDKYWSDFKSNANVTEGKMRDGHLRWYQHVDTDKGNGLHNGWVFWLQTRLMGDRYPTYLCRQKVV